MRKGVRRFPVRLPLALVPLMLIPSLGGCAERRIRVTSEPAGARVWLNDEEIGVTPTQARFTFYGHYDLRLEKPGFEPYHGKHTASAPFHEYPGPDLVAAAWPANIRHTVEWHIELTPTPETSTDPETARADLIDRAAGMRERTLRDE